MKIHDKFDLRNLLSDIICDWLCEDGSCMTEGEHHDDKCSACFQQALSILLKDEKDLNK